MKASLERRPLSEDPMRQAVSPEICRGSARGRKKRLGKVRRGDVPAMLTREARRVEWRGEGREHRGMGGGCRVQIPWALQAFVRTVALKLRVKWEWIGGLMTDVTRSSLKRSHRWLVEND